MSLVFFTSIQRVAKESSHSRNVKPSAALTVTGVQAV